MKTGIIIINWNGIRDTIECLESLSCADGEKEIFVIDNASSNEEAKKIQSLFPNISVLALDNNYGFSYANNRGIELALSHKCDAVLILNNDTTVTKNFLDKLIRTFQNDPSIGIVTPKILFYGTHKVWAAGGKMYYPFARGINIGENQNETAVTGVTHPDFISGCCMLIPAAVITSIRFEEKYFLYFEDTDLSFRIKNAGYSLTYCPESLIYHKSGQSSGPLLSYRRMYYLSRNKLLFVKSCFTYSQKIIFWICFPWQTLFMFGYFILINFSKSGVLIRAWIHGIIDYFENKFGPMPSRLDDKS
jgi:GT2 family glycosyltransferase